MKEIDTEQNVHSIFKGFTFISKMYKDTDYGILVRNLVFYSELNELYKNQKVFDGTNYCVYMSVRQIAKKWFNDCISPAKISRMLKKLIEDGLVDKLIVSNNLQESWYKPSKKLLELLTDEVEKTKQEAKCYAQYRLNKLNDDTKSKTEMTDDEFWFGDKDENKESD